MKTKFILTSLSALLISVAGANAMEYRPFVGASMGLGGLKYSSEMDDHSRRASTDLPTDFFAFGFEAGTRFGEYSKIYNGGVTLNFDMTTASDMKDKFTSLKYAEISTLAISATYDNYIRLSGDKTSRIDLVLGAGLGTMKYEIDYAKFTELSDNEAYSPMFAFKAGLDFELTKNITLSAVTRLFVPTRSHYAADTHYFAGGAVKYMF